MNRSTSQSPARTKSPDKLAQRALLPRHRTSVSIQRSATTIRPVNTTEDGALNKTASMGNLPKNLDLKAFKDEQKVELEKANSKTKPKLDQPRLNYTTWQRINNAKEQTAMKNAEPKIQKEKTTIALEVSRKVVEERNRLRAFDALHKKLEEIQSEFMNKLRTLGALGHDKHGAYKLVALDLNNECKFVVHEDDLHFLPKCLPIELVNELNDRCRAVVDLGFKLLLEKIAIIQTAADEKEASAKLEDLQQELRKLLEQKLSELSQQVNRLCGPKEGCPNTDPVKLHRELTAMRNAKVAMEKRYNDAIQKHSEELAKLKKEHQFQIQEDIAKRVGNEVYNEMETLKESNCQLQERLQDLKLSLENGQKAYKKQNERTQQLEQEIIEEKQKHAIKVKNLENKLGEQSAEMLHENETKNSLQLEVATLKNSNCQLQESLQALKLMLEDGQKNSTMQKDQMQKLEEELEKQTFQHNIKEKNFKNKMDEKCGELALMQASVLHVQECKRTLQLKIGTLKDSNNKLQESLQVLELALEEAKNSSTRQIQRIQELEQNVKEVGELKEALLKMKHENKAKDGSIMILKQQIESLEQHKDLFTMRIENDRINEEKLKAQLEAANLLKTELQAQINSCEKQSQLEGQLRHELELKKEALTKSELLVARLEHQAERDRQLLQVRTELITNLQQKEKDQQNKINDMYSRDSDKKLLLNQVHNKLAAKNEEFQNLFSTLENKQREIRKKDEIIELVQESNSRNAMLRAKQEEKNVELEQEIENLKRTIHNLVLGSQFQTLHVEEQPNRR